MKDKTLKSRIEDGMERLRQLKADGETPNLTRDWSADSEEKLKKALEGGMNPNIDIIKDFSKLQAENRALGKSNIELAGKLLALQEKINNLKAYEVYVTTVEENLPLVEALKYLTEEHVDSGQHCDATVIDLINALKNLLKE